MFRTRFLHSYIFLFTSAIVLHGELNNFLVFFFFSFLNEINIIVKMDDGKTIAKEKKTRVSHPSLEQEMKCTNNSEQSNGSKKRIL